MKNLKLIALILMATATLFGCRKKGVGGAKDDTYYFKANVNGALKESRLSLTGEIGEGDVNDPSLAVSIYGNFVSGQSGGEGLEMHIFQYTGLGTYILTPVSDHSRPNLGNGTYREATEPRQNYIFSSSLDGGTGKIIVTTFENNIISGTFEFKGVSPVGTSRTVTNGSFKVKLVKK